MHDMHRKQNMNKGTPKGRDRHASQTEGELFFPAPSFPLGDEYLFVTIDCAQYLIPL